MILFQPYDSPSKTRANSTRTQKEFCEYEYESSAFTVVPTISPTMRTNSQCDLLNCLTPTDCTMRTALPNNRGLLFFRHINPHLYSPFIVLGWGVDRTGGLADRGAGGVEIVES